MSVLQLKILYYCHHPHIPEYWRTLSRLPPHIPEYLVVHTHTLSLLAYS